MFDASDAPMTARARAAFDELVSACLTLGGSITGEHGVGVLKTPYMESMVGATERELMAGIKSVFDPTGILIPGAVSERGGGGEDTSRVTIGAGLTVAGKAEDLHLVVLLDGDPNRAGVGGRAHLAAWTSSTSNFFCTLPIAFRGNEPTTRISRGRLWIDRVRATKLDSSTSSVQSPTT